MKDKAMIRPIRAAWTGWLAVSVLVPVYLALVYLWRGQAGIQVITPTGPFSKFWLTVFAVIFAWLLGGLLLWLVKAGRIHRDNLLTWAGFFIVSFLYVNLLRERLDYGDLDSYILGATNLYNNQPFDNLYIYPPFWAMLLKPLVPFGRDMFLVVTWILNLLMLMGFYFLLGRVLEHYGFTPRLAALAATVFMAANMPLLRTMYYMQVNLHVLNLIFISLLAYPRSRLLSALALSLAIHFKVSPAVLALAFLLERDWRWLAWLAFFTLAIFGLTVLSDGLQPYMDYLHNLSLLNGPRPLIFRETSFDSFFWSLTQIFQFNHAFTRIAIYLSKFLLGAAVVAVLVKAVRGKAYYAGAAPALFNAVPPLMILMNMSSPLVWEHHAVFLVIAFMALLRGLSTPAEWTWFGIAYFVEFLIPAIDFFPWSYVRLLAPLFVLWLLWRAAGHPGESPFFGGLNRRLEKLPTISI